MDVTSVSLTEVLSAASMRAASLVPETSGYLALAIADGSARLPFGLEDGLVALTTEGTVQVARGSLIVPPEEAARRVRDVLARLLASSIGSAPALAQAARPRTESSEGVDGFIRELEAALVPVNRAAARRALARLARETVRAKDGGKLRRRRRRAEAPAEPPPPATPQRAPAAFQDAVSPPRPPAFDRARQSSPGTEGIDVEFSQAPAVRESRVAVETFEDLGPTPADPPLVSDEAPTTIDTSVDVIAHDATMAFASPSRRSDVEDLLGRFVVSDLTTPESMGAARASLKRLAGLDPTPPPPTAEELKKYTQKPPAVATPVVRIDVRPPRSNRPLPRVDGQRASRWTTVALVALGLVIAGLLGHFLPRWLDQAELSLRTVGSDR